MGVLIRQIYDQAPETPPKRLFPIVQVTRNSTVLNTVPEFGISKSEENIGDSLIYLLLVRMNSNIFTR